MTFRRFYLRPRRLLIGLVLVSTGVLCLLVLTSNVPVWFGSQRHRSVSESSPLGRMSRNTSLNSGPLTTVEIRRNTIPSVSSDCRPLHDTSSIKTPFKFYIYDLPAKFNTDLARCMSGADQNCYDLSYCGMGEELYQETFTEGTQLSPIGQQTGRHGVSVRNTNQFALEVVMHYKLQHSQYRTLHADQADIFYIPAYTGLNCLCKLGNLTAVHTLFDQLINHIKTLPHFIKGKPHFSTLGKIQREQASTHCPYLKYPETGNITFIAIEKEVNDQFVRAMKVHGTSLIVAPYPSYVHFTNSKSDTHLLEYSQLREGKDFSGSKFVLNTPTLTERPILLLLAAGQRRSNPFRAQLMDQFHVKTRKSYDEFFADSHVKISNTTQVMLVTDECYVQHRSTTILWMQRSAFCLQPPGDSPTRKSFYDAILSGCIPVTFIERHSVQRPFQHRLNYSDFTVEVPATDITKGKKNILDIISAISPDKVNALHNNLLRVAKWFQYSLPDLDQLAPDADDAVSLILEQLQTMYHL